MNLNNKISTYVLIHGAFHGAWCWRAVAAQLREAGQRVFTPTLTGLGERSHLAAESVNLRTHITDVGQVLEYEDLDEIILVGHSYASYVVAGVADGYSDRIKRLVYLDSYLPKSGTNFFSNIPQAMLDQLSAELIDAYLVPAFSPEFFGVLPANSEQWNWVKQRLSPQPLASFTQELILNKTLEGMAVDYIRCSGSVPLAGDTVYERIKELPGWNYHLLDSAHDAMVTTPVALGNLLLEIDT